MTIATGIEEASLRAAYAGRLWRGLGIVYASRRDHGAPGATEALGKAGYWLIDGAKPVKYLGRERAALQRCDDLIRTYEAAYVYLRRRDRLEHPEGEFDSAGRWTPSGDERQGCCALIRSPSRAYPYSLMTHCRSAEHVAATMNADRRGVKSRARKLEDVLGDLRGGAYFLDCLPRHLRYRLIVEMEKPRSSLLDEMTVVTQLADGNTILPAQVLEDSLRREVGGGR